jgi:uncharacterized protein YndB with AHSA1/START domain
VSGGGVPAGAEAHVLTLRRTIDRPRQEVFEAWTDPEALMTWFGGVRAKTLTAAVDLRVGGAYRLTMQSGPETGTVEGLYREVDPPERLVYTWRWNRPEIDGGRQSLVTVEFRDRDGATEVVITHAGIETEESFAFHTRGWAASLERLEQVLLPAGPAGRVDNGGDQR